MNTNYFVCDNCRKHVSLSAPGTKNRNHCPYCLASKHVDIEIGDRNAKCQGIMLPIGKLYKPDGEEMLIHKCGSCGQIRKNRVAGDDSYELLETLPVVDFDSLQ